MAFIARNGRQATPTSEGSNRFLNKRTLLSRISRRMTQLKAVSELTSKIQLLFVCRCKFCLLHAFHHWLCLTLPWTAPFQHRTHETQRQTAYSSRLLTWATVGADLLVPPMSLILEDTEWRRSQLVQHERPRFQGYSNAGCRFLFYTLLFLISCRSLLSDVSTRRQ